MYIPLLTTTLPFVFSAPSASTFSHDYVGDEELTVKIAQAKWVPLSTSRGFRRRSRAMSFASFSAFAAGRSVNAPSKIVDGGLWWFLDEILDFSRSNRPVKWNHDSPRSCYTLVEHLLRVHQYSSAS